jgi:AraC-like DNA-binding protein
VLWRKLAGKRKHNLILSFFCLLFVIMLGIVGIYYYSVNKDAMKHRVDSYKDHHEKTYLALYFLTDKTQSVYNQLLGDPYITEWTQNPNLQLLDMYNLSEIQKTFNRLINSHGEIISIYLHNRKNDIVLSTSFLLSQQDQFPNRRIFDAFYKQEQGNAWFPSGKEIVGNANSPDIISFISGLVNNGKFGTLAININGNSVRNQLEQLNKHVLWVDTNDKVLFSSHEGLAEAYMNVKKDIGSNGQWKLNDQYIFVTSYPKESWKVITIVPQEEMMSGVNRMNPYLYAILLLALILSFYFRHVYYMPIKAYKLNLQKNMDDLQHNFFVNLFTGKLKSWQIPEEGLQYGLDLEGGYLVVVFEIDDYYNHLLTMDGEERFFMNKNVFNSIKWIFDIRFKAYSVKTEYEKITVLLSRQSGNRDDLRDLEETIRYLQNDIRENCDLTVCAGISSMFDHLDQAPSEYVNALRALDYKTLYGKHISAKYKYGYDYPLEQINEILDYLRRGEAGKIEASLNRLFGELTADDIFNPQWVTTIFTGIMSGIAKFVIESRYPMRDIFDEDVFVTLYSYDMLEDKKNYILMVCTKLIDYEHNQEDRVRNATSQMIMDYIHNNYDKPISLTILADTLQMNTSYLSSFFKQHMGIRFVSYINKLRIQKSMALLLDEKQSVQQIAEKCGYDTVHSFIRNFKKTYHMPPNEYRMQMKENEKGTE